MSDVLAFAEQRNGSLRGVAAEVTSAAATVAGELGGEVHAVVVGGPGVGEAASELAGYGAAKIVTAEDDALADYRGEGYAPAVARVVEDGDYEAVLFPATAQGTDLAPRVAALLDVPLATEATGLRVEDGELTVVRPVYAGKALATVTLDARPKVVSLRPTVFQPEEREATGAVEAVDVDVDPGSWGSRLVEVKQTGGERLDVAEAPMVVAGGRGMGDPDNWHLLEELRDAMGDGVALGASRAVVDAGWRPHGEQVGQTGKTVSPRLYIAIGISGAIQHLAGMRTSNVIVAVNRDPDAPIFDVADYGIVGDLFEVVPRLTEEIGELREESG